MSCFKCLVAAAATLASSVSYAAGPVQETASGLRFELAAEFIWLERGETENIPLAAPGLSSDEVDLEGAPGVGLEGAAFMGDFGIGARFMGGFEWDETAALADADTFFSLPTINVPGGAPATFDYSSELNSFEGNLIWSAHRQFAVFAGVRAVELDESLLTDIDNGAATYGVETSNDMLGPQIGIAADLGEGPGFFLHGDARLAFLFNDREVDFTTAGIGGPLPSGSASDETESLLLELSARAGYRFDRFELFGSYRYLQIEDVAIATENYDAVNIDTGAGSPQGSDLDFHAFTIGVRAAF
jgi:opacity protein-like surface antigen